MKNITFAIIAVALLALTGCAANPEQGAVWKPAQKTVNQAAQANQQIQAQQPAEIGMPNPASVKCEKQEHGTVEFFELDGGQAGLCNFPDGSICEEWEFYRGECKKGLCFKQCDKKGTANEGIYDSCTGRLLHAGTCSNV